MKISELMQLLMKLQIEHGDLPICIEGDMGNGLHELEADHLWLDEDKDGKFIRL